MKRGFTLIELLVVIAIIGLLSSVVLASLNSARLKASDAAVRSNVEQLRNVMALEFSDSGSYAAIKNGGTGSGWIAAGGSCSNGFSGNYAAQGAALCGAIIKATGTACGSLCFGFQYTIPDAPDKFSITAYLPSASAQAGQARYLCMGSSGAVSVSNIVTYNDPGCFANP